MLYIQKCEPQNMMLRKRSQLQKTMHCMSPLIEMSGKRQIHEDGKQISGCLGLAVGTGSEANEQA
jgi:hypothetical protein